MPVNLKPRKRKTCLTGVLTVTGLCLLLSLASALSNFGLPQPDTADRLSDLDQARLAEALQLRAELGERVWPGWNAAQRPVIVWNSAYEFLIGYPGLPPADWEAVPGETYHRRPAENPQNFAVPVGDEWAGSIATKAETDAFLIGAFREMFPPIIEQIFPYRLLIQPSETQIGALLHEDFHAYMMTAAPGRMEIAEAAHHLTDEYDAASEAFAGEMKEEYALLAQALQAESDLEAVDLVWLFLQARDDRRQAYALSPELVDYERWLEWEEGTAKYVEVASLQIAYQAGDYAPLLSMETDPDFKGYQTFEQRWSQELVQLRNPSGSPETRFYMTGMAECFLLERLLPGWQDLIPAEGVFLEDLLRLVVER
ncbi:MAG: hypothetical protein JXB85_08100 [Anaerolineales bacterium]|nr:hypothetical protein [Anaerolineales bacterium]